LGCFFLLVNGRVAGQKLTSAKVAFRGIADLRNVEFNNNTVSLNGEWAFAWRKLIQTKDTLQFNEYVSFPSLWSKCQIDGVTLPAQGFASYALTVILPKNRPVLSFYLPDVYSAFRFYINGQLFAANGHPDSLKKTTVPKWNPITKGITETGDTLHLLLQVANWDHNKGGTYKDIIIGDTAVLQVEKEKFIASDFLLAGCLFMGGLFFLGLYMFGTKDKATLYFSLFCLIYSYRFIGSGYYSLHSLFPDISWYLTVRAEYFSLFASILLFMLYVRNLYPNDFYKPVMNLLLYICAGVSVLPLITPSLIFTKIISPFLILMFFCIAFVMITFIKAYTRNRIAAGYALHSIAVLMIVQLVLNLEYFGIIIPSQTVLFIGYVTFFFLQSLILSFRFAYTLRMAKQEAEEGLRAKSEFLSTMSHEIRTPLNSVIGMTNLMQKNKPRPDQKEHLEVLQFSANNLLNIVNDILDYNKIEAGKIAFEHISMDVADILKKITSAAKTAAEDKGIYLGLHIDEKLNTNVVGDPTRFFQVINNLVSNAVKFTKVGGVDVSAIVQQRSSATIQIRFSVRDTGIGISDENQKRIFDQFTQADSSTSRSFGGTGLGLAISKRILDMQGCQLMVQSTPNIGSEFYFTQEFTVLAQSVEEKQAEPVSAEEIEFPLQGVEILLVEDNPMNVFVARSFLEGWGAIIEEAENGQEALDKLDENRHRIVLMDLHMPVLDGYDATRILRERGVKMPIVALTASLPSEIQEEINGLGIDDIVLKPFVPEDLLKTILQMLRK
jgi:signal transduction histidine kinase/CheY-like chemotaxis protein